MPVGPERLSIELTRTCAKACSFCYNGSNPEGDRGWTPDEVVALVRDAAAHGLCAVSFGGGEPLESAALFPALRALDGQVFRSVTTSGLGLDDALPELLAARPDKVHVSIHHPDREAEVSRVIAQVGALAAAGIPSGVNLLVRRSGLDAAARAVHRLAAAGIGPERTMILPMRGADTPSADEIGRVGGPRFQSVTCLVRCGPSPRFVSLDSQKRAAWCSYTVTRRVLPSLDHAGLRQALDGLGLQPCGP